MLISNINKVKNNVRILLDNGEKIFLRYEVFLKNGFRKGDEINEEEIAGLIRQNQFFFIKESAYRFLGIRLHSEKELQRKLLAKKYDKDIVASVLKELKDNNYLDDELFAREYTDERINKKSIGPNRVRLELKSKGVASEVIDRIMQDKAGSPDSESAYQLVQKKLQSSKYKDLDKRKLSQKLYAFLLSRGFDFDVIKEVVNKSIQPGDEEE
ncbi:MAG: regulatory protein RecX [Ignavibacteriales bacterium]